jgi:hypothetical protein
MGGGDIISGNRDCWAREREMLLRRWWEKEREREALCSARCCICGPWGVLSHRTLSWKSHVTARFVIIKYTQRAAVCAHYYPQLCAVAATPAVMANFAFSTTRSRTAAALERSWEWVRERAAHFRDQELRVSERVSVYARMRRVGHLWICTRFLACCCCPWLLVHFQRPRCPHQTNCFSITMNSLCAGKSLCESIFLFLLIDNFLNGIFRFFLQNSWFNTHWRE